MLRTTLKVFLSLMLITSCQQREAPPVDSTSSRNEGKQPNTITTFGDTIPAKGKWIDPDSVAKPKTIPVKGKTEVIPANTNVHPAGTPRVVQIPKDLTVITPGKEGVPLPKEVLARGEAAPHPNYSLIPAFPPIFKDAATASIRYLAREQGLKHSNVYSILEDSHGYIWFGGSGGVSRYDGASFTHFVLDGAGGVRCMLEDNQGVFWFGTERNGLIRYDGQSFNRFSTKEGLSGNWVRAILQDGRGDLWFGTDNGVSRYHPPNNYQNLESWGSFTHYTTKEALNTNSIWSILEDNQGYMWFGGEKGVSRYDPPDNDRDRESRGSFTHYTAKEGLSNDWVRAILEDSRGSLWFATWGGGVSRYDPSANSGQGSFTHYTTEEGLSSNSIWSILKDKQGNLWFGTWDKGVCRYDPDANGGLGSFTHYTDKEGLNDNFVQPILEDSHGNLWFGTIGGGVSCFSKTEFSFYKPEGLRSNSIRSLLEDSRENLWIGFLGDGLTCYDGANFTNHLALEGLSSIRSILEDSQGNIWFACDIGISRFDGFGFTHYTAREGLGGNWVQSILEDEQGSLWFGTRNSGLSRYDGHSFTHYTIEEGLSGNSISAMLKDEEGSLWFGTSNNGLNRYDGHSFVHYTIEDGLSSNGITSLLEDSRGYLWIGTNHGLNRLILNEAEGHDPNPDRGQNVAGAIFTHFTGEESLNGKDITSMLEDSRGNIWIGTQNDGVSRYNPGSNGGQDESFTSYTPKQGLVGDDAKPLAEDKQGNIWIMTLDGITLLTPPVGHSDSVADSIADHYQVFSFNSSNGLKNVGQGLVDRQDRMWLRSNQGLAMLDLSQFQLPTAPPARINLSTIEVEGNFIDYRRLTDSTYRRRLVFGEDLADSFDSMPAFDNYPLHLSLPHFLNHLTFHFSAIDWAAPNMLRYSYFLEGFDQDWSQSKTENKADYRKLPPGSYTFKVKALGAAQKWSEVFEYSFRILPPWWLTWWAKAFYLALILAAVYLLFLWRTGEQRKKIAWQQQELHQERQLSERLQQVDKLKDQFLANTSHELRTPLQGIIGLSESLYEREDQEDKQEDLSMIITSGKRLNNLVNDILDFSKLKNHDIELLQKPVGIYALVDIVLKNNAPLIRGKNLELINAVPEDLPAAFADENRLQQILYNLVGNAIKFTETGHVRVVAETILPPAFSGLPSETLAKGGGEQAPNNLLIFVEDTGTGIPENKREAIFQEFEQGDASTTREFAGTGLGLSISKRLAELHGGQMWVESNVGQGSTFFFTLPVSTVEATTLTTTQRTAGKTGAAYFPPSTLNKDLVVGTGAFSKKGQSHALIRILVVDDEPINQQVLKNHLSGKGFHLTQAMNGEEAIKAIQNEPSFDLVLLDVMMPRMSGYEVCQKIREKYLPSELPVIMVTAKNQLQDIVQGLYYGANDYLPKPFHKEELLARINTQLDLHRIFSVAGRFVPNEFLNSLNRDRLTEVMLGDHTEKEVTVLFADIRDYTTLAETMTPEENFNFINAFHGRMGPVVRQCGGFVNQYLGDAIMAIFPNKPEDALRAAIDMQKVLRQYNAQRRSQNRPALTIGLGLHCGPLIMGIIGDENRMDAATIADTVNLASRLEGLTKYYGVAILLSEDTIAKMEDRTSFYFRYLGKVVVKGKKESVGLYECFDGDAPETATRKAATQPGFEKGLEQFLNREFPQAAATFDNVLKVNAEDQPARLFMNKSSEYLLKGVPNDWTGVEVMTFK